MALIYEVGSIEESDLVVSVVNVRGAADLCVCKSDVRGAAEGRDDVWCFVDHNMKKAMRVFFTKRGPDTELIVCYVPHRGAAGWKHDHVMQGFMCKPDVQ